MTAENRIFLAHASEDKPQVRELYDQLKTKGFSPWLDEIDLLGGQEWDVEISNAIRHATIFLACLSKRAVGKRGYIQTELRYALSAFAERPAGSIYLIPVRLDECEVPDLRRQDIGISLRGLQWVDLFGNGGFEKLVGAISCHAKAASREPEIFRDIDVPWCPEMVILPAGKFLMGSRKEEKDRWKNEGPQHEVTISKPFALGRYQVTFEEFVHFCDETGREKPNDEGWGGCRRPVVNVSHEDAQTYCAWLSQVTDATYRLPSEAEWEYSCRAGTTTRFSFGNNVRTDQANYNGNYSDAGDAKYFYREKSVPVGSLPANPWGLFEMHGNVREWCADGQRTYTSNSVTDPLGPLDNSVRVLRGGSWFSRERGLRSARRNAGGLGVRAGRIGFRCVRELGGVLKVR